MAPWWLPQAVFLAALPMPLLVVLLLARHYVVTSPAVIYHPHTAMLWVHLSDLPQPAQVTVQLQRAGGAGNITLLERKVQEPHVHLNVTFAVSVTPGCLDTPLPPARLGAGLVSPSFYRISPCRQKISAP